MLYQIIRPLATIGLTIYFRKIYFSGTEHIPLDKPLLLAANHPTAFLDPCLLACYQDRPLNFLVRGDFFKKSFYRMLLEDLHMIPIYRLKDAGLSGVKQNYETFAQCYQTLAKGEVIMILAEGSTEHEKRLRPIKKGTARIAFGTLETYPDLDLHILPIGLNYTHADRFRSEVMIDCAPPIPVQNYLATYKEKPNQAVLQVTKELEKRLKSKVIHIEKTEDECLAEQLLMLYRNEYLTPIFPLISPKNNRLKAEKSIVTAINTMKEEDKNILKSKAENYVGVLEKYDVNDLGLKNMKLFNLNRTIGLFIGLVPFLLGYGLNFLPMRAAKWVGDTYIKHVSFYSSVVAATGVVTYGIYFLFLLGGSLLTSYYFDLQPEWLLFVLTLSLPFLGYFALFYQQKYQQWKAARRAVKLSPQIKQDLLNLRLELLNSFQV